MGHSCCWHWALCLSSSSLDLYPAPTAVTSTQEPLELAAQPAAGTHSFAPALPFKNPTFINFFKILFGPKVLLLLRPIMSPVLLSPLYFVKFSEEKHLPIDSSVLVSQQGPWWHILPFGLRKRLIHGALIFTD